MVVIVYFFEVVVVVEWLGKFGSVRMIGFGVCVFSVFEYEY